MIHILDENKIQENYNKFRKQIIIIKIKFMIVHKRTLRDHKIKVLAKIN